MPAGTGEHTNKAGEIVGQTTDITDRDLEAFVSGHRGIRLGEVVRLSGRKHAPDANDAQRRSRADLGQAFAFRREDQDAQRDNENVEGGIAA